MVAKWIFLNHFFLSIILLFAAGAWWDTIKWSCHWPIEWMDEITKVFCSNGCKPLVRMFNGNLTFCSFSSGFCQNFHGPYVCFTSFHRDGQSIILLQSTCIALWKCCIVSNREYPYGVTDIVRQQGATRHQNTLQYGDKQWSHTRINISEES